MRQEVCSFRGTKTSVKHWMWSLFWIGSDEQRKQCKFKFSFVKTFPPLNESIVFTYFYTVLTKNRIFYLPPVIYVFCSSWCVGDESPHQDIQCGISHSSLYSSPLETNEGLKQEQKAAIGEEQEDDSSSLKSTGYIFLLSQGLEVQHPLSSSARSLLLLFFFFFFSLPWH